MRAGNEPGLCSFCYDDCTVIDAREARLLKLAYHHRFHKAAFLKSIVSHPIYVSYLARKYGVRIVCDTSKSGRWAAFLDRYCRWGLDLRFLFLFRDPRAVIASHLRKKRDIDVSIAKYRVQIGRVLDLREKLDRGHGNARYVDIRYEEFAQDPETGLRTVCTFLGIDFQPAMLDYDLHEHHIIGGNDKARVRVKKKNNQRIKYNKSDIDWYLNQSEKFFVDERWKTELSGTERKKVGKELAGELERLGYAV